MILREFGEEDSESNLNYVKLDGNVGCDRVANGVVEAYKKIGDVRRSSIVRLQGTNAEAGARIIDESRLKVKLATLLRRRR